MRTFVGKNYAVPIKLTAGHFVPQSAAVHPIFMCLSGERIAGKEDTHGLLHKFAAPARKGQGADGA